MKKNTSKYFVLVLLALMFCAPGITAYLFYQHPQWVSTTRVNKGTLVEPAVVLSALEGRKAWRILYWSPNTCGQSCLQQLDLLARVRLALGRKLYQVDQWLVLGKEASVLGNKEQELIKTRDFHMVSAKSSVEQQLATLAQEEKVFIVNPENYIILSYKVGTNPDHIYKDLKLLLSTNEIKRS